MLQTISVEYNLIPEDPASLVKLLEGVGYVHFMLFDRSFTHDYIFAQKSLLDDPKWRNHTFPIINRVDNAGELDFYEDWDNTGKGCFNQGCG